ncbi:MAG TPA: DHHA1 domain-containing protein [Blastocatellia bacterium]|jgi:alanyl-tRNA synthetase|nr:DHHA1 domain-containing protein [Blastocatellia bacterium]
MKPTERLYFTDSRLLDFSATVIDVVQSEQQTRVVLDRTAFYPTGGGQPNDTGKLDGLSIVDVSEDEDGRIFHVIEGGAFTPGQSVQGLVEANRRFDHLQQHSGQHILSQAFIQACNAETRSFHLGAKSSTIDIELTAPTDDHMRAAEEIANSIILDDRPMRVHLVNEEDAARLPLRKESAVKGTIRVIEVEDFDWSPCGGTHASRTGQIGLVAIKSYERARKLTRVEFVCGRRVLVDYHQANDTAIAVARQFSADRDSTPELVDRTLQENKTIKKRVRDLIDIAMAAQARQMLSEANAANGFKLITAVFEDKDLDELRVLAAKIVEQEPAVALLGTKDASAARLVFARSATLTQNMGQLLSEACGVLGGRGGGRPELGQGGGPAAEKLGEAIRLAADSLLAATR